MSDNGSCYVAGGYGHALHRLGIKHHRTRPYRPRTNGKAERFIQTPMNEWAYARVYGSPPNEPPPCRSTSTATTTSAPTAASATNHRPRD